MAWLRSEQSLLHHPKTAHLQVLLKVDKDVVIGRLHRLWWWCLDYALDGDLSKQEGKVIEQACGIPLQTLIRSGFVDGRPYRRIHDWWGNQGAYLRSRFHKDPEKWQRIEKLYKSDLDMSKDVSKHSPRISPIERTDVENGRTDVTDVRTDVDVKDARGSSLGAPPALSEKPRNAFDMAHVERRLTNVERVQSKLREAGFLNGK
jgi:hypothetical protein